MNASLLRFAAATENELFEPDLVGGKWIVNAVQTKETIEDFVNAFHAYNECTPPRFGEIAGFKFVAFAQVQARKGDMRRALSVVDLGDDRYALNCDLTEFI